MNCYPALLKDDGSGTLISWLKKGFRAYNQNAQLVIADFEKEDKAANSSWHYQQYLHIDKDWAVDRIVERCCYCGNTSSNCKFHLHFKAWFEAACLVALVMPSSAAAERVFSLLKNFFSEQQTHILSDAVYLSLYLSTNKRAI